jgi:hypothetical protein
VKISTLPEFASASEPASPFTPAAPAAEGSLFGSPSAGYSAPEAGAGYAASSNGAEADVFSAPATTPVAPAMADLFASPAEPREPAAPGPSVSSFGGFDAPVTSDPFGGRSGGNGSVIPASGLTGQRHENSVLFSLSNLEALAKPSPAPSPAIVTRPSASPGGTTEGSGLIDIRAMASMTLGSSSPGGGSAFESNDLPAFSAPQFSPVAPVLLPVSSSSGTPKWAIALLAVLGVLIIGLVALAIKLFSGSSAPPVATAPAPVAPVVAPAPTAPNPPPARAQEPPPTPPPAAGEKLPPREPAAAPAAVAQKSDRGSSKSGGRSSAGGKKGPGKTEPTERPVAALPSPTARPEKPEAPAKPKDDLERLLEQAGGGRSRPSRQEEDAPKPSAKADPLGREDVVRGMKAIDPKAHECFVQYKVPGIVNVKIAVNPGGKVTKVDVTGKFAGTPSGSCVEAAVKTAKFPPNPGQSFDYIVPLR